MTIIEVFYPFEVSKGNKSVHYASIKAAQQDALARYENRRMQEYHSHPLDILTDEVAIIHECEIMALTRENMAELLNNPDFGWCKSTDTIGWFRYNSRKNSVSYRKKPSKFELNR